MYTVRVDACCISATLYVVIVMSTNAACVDMTTLIERTHTDRLYLFKKNFQSVEHCTCRFCHTPQRKSIAQYFQPPLLARQLQLHPIQQAHHDFLCVYMYI
jgi:hypothetical protein